MFSVLPELRPALRPGPMAEKVSPGKAPGRRPPGQGGGRRCGAERSASSWRGGPRAGGAPQGRGAAPARRAHTVGGAKLGGRRSAASGAGRPSCAPRGEGRPCLTSGGGARPGGPCLRPAGCWGRAQCTARPPCPLSPCSAAAERPGRPRVWPVSTEQRVGRGRGGGGPRQPAGRLEEGRREGGGGGGAGREHPVCAGCTADSAARQPPRRRAGLGTPGARLGGGARAPGDGPG